MPARVHGVSSAHQNLTENIEYYIVYAKSPNAYSDPINATGVDIMVTRGINDISQKNFDTLLMTIGLRAMPVIMNDPCPTEDLLFADAPTLSGEGYVWKFAVERTEYFENRGPGGTVSNVGYLVDELHNVKLANGVLLQTTGPSKNIEFAKEELWRECKQPIVTERKPRAPKPNCDKRITYGVGKKGK